MRHIDTLIYAGWVIPVEPEGLVLEQHAVVIHEGKIIAIMPSDEATREFSARITHRLYTHAVIPGLINTHTHAAMNLLRGYADDMPLMEWLHEHIWPAEKRWVSADFVADGTRLAIAEMLQSGVTCFNDMYFYPDVVSDSVKKSVFVPAWDSLWSISPPSGLRTQKNIFLKRIRCIKTTSTVLWLN